VRRETPSSAAQSRQEGSLAPEASRPISMARRRPSSTIDVDGEGGHRTMVPPELQILVLFYHQGGTHLFARTSKFGS
jgi:hypothetical protein